MTETLLTPQDNFGFVGFRARSDSGQSIPNNTWTTIIFEDQVYDVGFGNNNYNATNGEFTVPVTGYYHTDAAAMLAPATFAAGERMLLSLIIDGTNIVNGFRDESDVSRSSYQHSLLTADFYATEGDVITMDITQNQGAAVSLFANDDYNFWNVHLIGRTG